MVGSVSHSGLPFSSRDTLLNKGVRPKYRAFIGGSHVRDLASGKSLKNGTLS